MIMRKGVDVMDSKTIEKIKENYKKMEKNYVNQLFFQTTHGSTIGRYREKIWEEMFESIVPKKFVIEQSVFIIDSKGNVSNEVDLAIFDEMYTPYVFRYGEIKFIPIEAVVAVVECKSTSMDEKLLENWINSIEQLKTSNRSVVRTINRIVCGEKEPVSTQTATRPLRILCCLNQEYKNLQEIVDFDVVIRAGEEKLDMLSIENEALISAQMTAYVQLALGYIGLGKSDIAENTSLALMNTLLDNLDKAIADSNDVDARSTLMTISALTVNGLTTLGKAGDWVLYPLNTIVMDYCNVAYKPCITVIFPYWIKMIYDGQEEINSYFNKAFDVVIEGRENI